MWREIRNSFRQLRGHVLFGTTIILLLSIGIGSNTLVFSLLNSLLLRPLPVRAPENLYLLQKNRTRQVHPDTSFFYRQFEAVGQRKTVIAAAIAEQVWANNSFQAYSSGNSVQLIATQIVSPNYFSELGIKAILGRVLTADDATESSNIPVVLSYQFWSSQFQKRRDILGQTIRVKNHPFWVVGVLPNGFHGIDTDRVPDVRFPISAALPLAGSPVTEPGGDSPIAFQVVVRLAEGVSAKRAAGEVLPMLDEMEESLWRELYARSSRPFPPSQLQDQIKWQRSYRISLLPVQYGVSALREQFSRAILLLMTAVGLLLFAVCANVAGLLLLRSEERRREIAIRVSVGASRWRLGRLLFIENALLAIPSAILGIALGYGLSPLLLKLLPPLGVGPYATPLSLDLSPDWRVFVFVLGTCLLTLLLFGIAPAMRTLKLDPNELLKRHSGGSAEGLSGTSTVAVQVAMAVLLLAIAIIMGRTFWNLKHLSPGFDQAHVIEFTIDPWDANYSETQAGELLRNLRQGVSELPGIRAVSFASAGLMKGVAPKTTVVPAGSTLPAKTFLNTSINRVTCGYFDSLGIPLLSGRKLEVHDVNQKPTPIVVNRSFAEAFFPGTDPIGKPIVRGVDGTKPPIAIIVGVVGTAKLRSLREQDPPIYYQPSDEANAGGTMYVRTRGDPKIFIRSVRSILRKLAPALPFADVFTLEQEVQNSLWQERLVTIMCAFFAVAALILSGTGLYGTLAYSVARRSKELGIRVALGAQVQDIVLTVSGRTLRAVSIGLLVGIAVSMCLLWFARTLVFGIDPFDPFSFVTAAAALVTSSLVAAIPPSWRAIRTDANVALRQE